MKSLGCRVRRTASPGMPRTRACPRIRCQAMTLRYTPLGTLVQIQTDKPTVPSISRQMQFPNIVALIDARIALLQQVRKLLATYPADVHLPPPRLTKSRKPTIRSSKRRQTKASPSAFSDNTRLLVASPEPVRLPFVAPRERSSASKRPVPIVTHSALVGKLPPGPVAVPPARVRAEAQRRILEENSLPMHEETAAEPNQILRKWLLEQQATTG